MTTVSLASLKQKALKFPKPLTSVDIDSHNGNMLEKNVKKYSPRREE